MPTTLYLHQCPAVASRVRYQRISLCACCLRDTQSRHLIENLDNYASTVLSHIRCWRLMRTNQSVGLDSSPADMPWHCL